MERSGMPMANDVRGIRYRVGGGNLGLDCGGEELRKKSEDYSRRRMASVTLIFLQTTGGFKGVPRCEKSNLPPLVEIDVGTSENI
mmetsp:Transcript_9409/g.20320  ORF Transcript_9409/g.20320 Transcript_9409/m.20320 type:complete len:85 (-) Transcript_9409:92-346(-)